MIIGLTGSFCSGKDTIAEYLVRRKGFSHFSLSDELREELKKRKIAPTRENLIRTGTALRREHGNAVLARRVGKKVKNKGKYIITSLRHPDEIKELRRNSDFVLVNVDAPGRVRFARMRRRRREGDPETFNKFVEFEKKEMQGKGPAQQLKRCGDMADVTFINNEDNRRGLYRKIDALLVHLKENRRPHDNELDARRRK